ncbi:MAG TPA: phosphomethylpyrimidine synthase ThiC, partial [Thermodesulfobacteriota bacterium]|nr:phosphomethylpyrimidine synthase ThiC [Thermodesulfobacteriota bacterium]
LGTKDRDRDMAKARRDLRWEDQYKLGFFNKKAQEIRNSRYPEEADTCTMCGSFCALDNVNQYFEDDLKKGIKA